jgi:FAD-dependent urate hydroxylase
VDHAESCKTIAARTVAAEKNQVAREHYVSTDEVLVIGAGPFGLSISAHLRESGVSHRIVGRPMDTWRAHMPTGMNLKSEPYASDMAAPKAGYDVAGYCRTSGLQHVNRVGPLSLERFLAYADWYTEKLVPDVIDDTVTEVTRVDGGFRVNLAGRESVTVRQVVIAIGVLPYAVMPDELSGLPAELVTHASNHHDLEPYRGKRVAVIGSGQSALETAALLHETGADVQIVMRGKSISWLDANPVELSLLGQIRRPATKLCEGWKCKFWNTPSAFRWLPEEMRVTKARQVLGPSGSWWLKDRVEGVIEVLSSHRLRGAKPDGSGIQLSVDGPTVSTVSADHVIAGTGFRVDLARLTYLPEQLRGQITQLKGYPVVNRAGESSVPGLYFAGASAAASLGPSERFIGGTHNSVRQLTRSVGRRAKGSRAATAGEPVAAAER